MPKLARVVIVGFPNVGKSSLFNRFLRRKGSLVHSLPGMTRDQIETRASYDNREYILVDTGGFFDSQEEPLSPKIKEKAWQASQGADIIIFVLDGKRGLLPVEKELFLSLKKLGKMMFVVVNKVDSPEEENRLGEFYSLGEGRIFAVSAEHKRNLEYLKSAIADVLPAPSAERERKQEPPLRIALIGRINVGKSSIVNRLCGQEKVIVSETPGTTRDSTDTLIIRDKRPFFLIDTAGIRKLSRTRDKREKASIIKTKKDINQADVICLILDAGEFPTRQDAAVAHLAQESGKPLLIALNKWDLIPPGSTTVKMVRERVFQKLEFVSYAPLIFISALTGRKVVKILELAEEVYASASKRIGTSRLNAFLAEVNLKYPSLSKSKRKFTIKYITQIGILPPTFALFTHSRVSLDPGYEKFFIQLLRKKYDFRGSTLRIFLRKS